MKVTDSGVGGSMSRIRLNFLQGFTKFQRKCDCCVPQIMCGNIYADCFAKSGDNVIDAFSRHFLTECPEAEGWKNMR